MGLNHQVNPQLAAATDEDDAVKGKKAKGGKKVGKR
jgi:hypothetical protein